MATIKAKFIGADGSLGYRKDQVYILTILETNPLIKWGLEIWRLDGTGFCPYTNWATFLKNWEIIKKFK